MGEYADAVEVHRQVKQEFTSLSKESLKLQQEIEQLKEDIEAQRVLTGKAEAEFNALDEIRRNTETRHSVQEQRQAEAAHFATRVHGSVCSLQNEVCEMERRLKCDQELIEATQRDKDAIQLQVQCINFNNRLSHKGPRGSKKGSVRNSTRDSSANRDSSMSALLRGNGASRDSEALPLVVAVPSDDHAEHDDLVVSTTSIPIPKLPALAETEESSESPASENRRPLSGAARRSG